MKQISILVLSIVLLLSALITGCTGLTPEPTPTSIDYTPIYTERAKTIFEEYQLDGEIRWVNKYSDSFIMIVTSEGFADKSNVQKVEILGKLLDIYVADSGLTVIPKVTSQGHDYSSNSDGELFRDGMPYPPGPMSTPFVMPKGDFVMSWDTYDSQYNTMGGILTITRHGSRYTEKLVYSDGSSDTKALTILSEGDEIKLTEDLNDYSGDYMVIESNGWLSYYDNLGLIYSVPPE
ncbi:MAG: hypothetical protein A2Y53_01515 [Chloroflexi bacterium RBG_16_47_49]|nr:MAG: hypothetical protein A2Y53_01515 [Chloroflexi bacterium RBG_16_47_49]